MNHEGNFDTAIRLINEAKEYEQMQLNFRLIKQKNCGKRFASYWDTSKESQTQYKLFTKFDKFWDEEFYKLSEYCQSIGIEFMSTPFDTISAEFLNEYMGCFKISSSDITNKPFIQQIAGYGTYYFIYRSK